MSSVNPQPSPLDSELFRADHALRSVSRGSNSGPFSIISIQGDNCEAKINSFSFSDIAGSDELKRVKLEVKKTARMLFEDAADHQEKLNDYKACRNKRPIPHHRQEASLGSQLRNSHKRLNSSQDLLATMTSASTKRSTGGSYKPSVDLSSTIRSKASAYTRDLQTSRDGELFEIKLQDFDFEKSVGDSVELRSSIFGPEPTKAFCTDCKETVMTSISLNLPTLSL